MKNNDCESNNYERNKDLKEFSEIDVKNIYDSVDESNGFGIDFAINLYRSDMKRTHILEKSTTIK
ncbi:MAG: hypothetical protein L3J83_02245 [Proteobacteria bacterium]|nr:hypothetical protein [Pseudomonadota bacterium]